MEMSARMVPAEFNDFAGLHVILRARAEELQLSRHSLDEIAGLPSGLAGKILSPRPKKRFGNISLPLLLDALGMKLVAMVDEAKTLALQQRITTGPRKASAVRSGHCTVLVSRRHLKRIQRLGGLNSRRRMSRKKASELGRLAANSRWGR
jgi:hypothetical protein